MPPIKAVFVDVSGVLVQNLLPDIYSRYEREHGIDREAFRDVFKYLHSGNRSQSDLQNYLQVVHLDPETWKSFTIDFRHSEGRNEPLYELLRQAKQKSVKIVVTSNNVSGLKGILSRFGLGSLPDIVITSAEIGYAKPDPAFWRFALKETKEIIPGITPADILVIDDHFENVQSAQALGFKVRHYSSDESTHNQIRSLLAQDPTIVL